MTSTAYTDFATVGPSATVTIPASGTALICVAARITIIAGNARQGFMSFSGPGVSASDAQAVGFGFTSNANGDATSVGSYVNTVGACFRVTGITTGSQTITAKYKSSTANTSTFANRSIVVIPLP
jgi:hypothetical protein